jgi:NDP-sugar pyrophosphorylase family protein
MQAVVLAAGKGARLQPLTLTRSKAMSPVAGKPLVERVLETLLPNGVDEVVLVVAPEDQAIRQHFGRGIGAPVHFVVQAERQGMAKALALAAPFLRDTFFVSACDNLTSVGHVGALVAAHQGLGAAATLSLMEIDLAAVSATGVVAWDDPFVRRIVEKPRPEEAPSTISSLPLYLFSPQILDFLPLVQPSSRGEYELQDAIQMLADKTGRVTGVFTPTRQQVTSASDLLALNLHYLADLPATPVVDASVQMGLGVRLSPPVLIGPETVIGAGASIGPRVYVEGQSAIGTGTLLCDSVVLRGASVANGARFAGQIVG